ncbi:chemotaxis protein CheC [Chitinibacter sp. FCG-7]|uniref:Chemotaxis protein CheC n=1 Tax=Chitinibacter mangrovi TaxID=3153927 RepID=A0AAU7FDC1_9NEIS
MREFTPLQQDAICEIFNISVGQAAATMSQMVGEEVLLSVPNIQFYTLENACELLSKSNLRICGVQQDFDGCFNGHAFLIFPENRSLELVRLMIGKNMPIEYLSELEQDALAEVGNIILNACLASLSEVFQQQFHCGLPILHIGSSQEVLQRCQPEQLVMLLHIQFTLADRKIEGYVIFIMNSDSLDLLVYEIEKFLSGIGPQASY